MPSVHFRTAESEALLHSDGYWIYHEVRIRKCMALVQLWGRAVLTVVSMRMDLSAEACRARVLEDMQDLEKNREGLTKPCKA